MLRYAMVALGLLICCWGGAVLGAGFTGKYQGVMANVPMRMVLLQKGGSLSGTADSTKGDHYVISGIVSGNAARIEALYTNNNNSLSFILTLDENGSVIWTPTLFGQPVGNGVATFNREGVVPRNTQEQRARRNNNGGGSVSNSQNGTAGSGRNAEGKDCTFVSLPNGEGIMRCR